MQVGALISGPRTRWLLRRPGRSETPAVRMFGYSLAAFFGRFFSPRMPLAICCARVK
jgi:hypothetical protein